MFISGQLGMDPKTMTLADGVEAQTDKALKNMGEILNAAGCTYNNGKNYILKKFWIHINLSKLLLG